MKILQHDAQAASKEHENTLCKSAGFSVIAYLVVALVIGSSVAGMLLFVSNITRETHRGITSVKALSTAEAGLYRALFMLQSTDTWTQFATNSTVAWTELGTGAHYTFTFSEITDNSIVVTTTGREPFGDGYSYRKIEVHAEHPIPEAFGYALFGNRIGFHNHMEEAYGLTITSDMWSNGELLWWRGLTLTGDMTAVGAIVLETKPAAVPATITTGLCLDGTPGSPYYAPDQGYPVPEPIPFPSYDFAGAKAIAVANGTYFATDAAFQAYITAHTTFYTNAQPYGFPSPLPGNPSNTLFLTTADGLVTGIVSKAVISNSVFYLDTDTTLAAECNTLLVISNAAIVSEGKVIIKRPLELYSSPSLPAIAAMGKIDITDKDHTDGDGGPIRIRGIVYTMDQSHIHQTDPYNAVSIDGIEVANYIHNCEWFWFNYAPWPGVKGFSEATGGQNLTISRWRELSVEGL